MLGVVTGVLLVASAAGAGGGQVEVVVASSGAQGCTGFLVESLSGAIAGCVPFAGGTYQPGGAAADGSVTFIEPYPDGTGTTELTRTVLVHPNGHAVDLYAPPGYDQVAAASISADGSKVASLRLGDSGNPTSIYVVNADGSGLRLVAPWNGAYLSAPAISPEGNSIAYWCVSPTPPDPTYSPHSPPKCGPLPDGSYRHAGLMLMNADGSNKRMIVIAPRFVADDAAAVGSLSWSPNGRWLTVDGLAPCRFEPLGCNQQVFAYRTDGSDLFNYTSPSRQVTHQNTGTGPAAPAAPQFCGSSSQILYESGSHAYLINRDGTHRRRMALVETTQPLYPVCVPSLGGEGPPPTVNVMRVTVPGVRTLSYIAARERLRRASFHVGTVRYAFSAQIRRDHVIAQYPRAGAHAHRSTKQGPAVKVVISRGPRP